MERCLWVIVWEEVIRFWASLVAQLVKNLSAMQETWVWSLGWEDPLEKGMATHSSIHTGEFHGLYSLWGGKELDMTERLSLHLIRFCYFQRNFLQNQFHLCTFLGDRSWKDRELHSLCEWGYNSSGAGVFQRASDLGPFSAWVLCSVLITRKVEELGWLSW